MNIVELLKKNGLRCTQVREMVLKALLYEGRPLSHSEMISKKPISEFDRVTIYRTLESLQKARLIHQIKGTDGISRYSANDLNDDSKCSGDHIHFHCSTCQKMTCLPEQALPWIKAPKGFEIHSKQLVVYGKCTKCAKKIKDKK